ncbi:MAG: RagB/SusD family nutrient uptake outer membrane protein [Candidatus Cryptobacteroides sp.]
MKTKIILAALSVLAVSSCSFLEENPESFVSSSNYYKTEAQCQSAVNSIYTQLRPLFNAAYWTVVEATTDIIYMPSDSDVNAVMDISPASCTVAATFWTAAYKMVMYANAAIAGIGSSPLDEEVRNPLIAEAKIMRAFWYYQLTCLFGDVPFYTEDVSDADVMKRVARLPRMSAVETRAFLIDDLQESIAFLPKKKASEIESGRAGWAMGQMLIAKMALWNAYLDEERDWFSVAVASGEELKNVYGNLSQYALEDLYFREKNTPEDIFEIQHTYNSGGLIYVSNLAMNCMPSGGGASGKFAGIEISELGKEAKVGTCSRPTLYFCQELQTEDGGDLRAAVNMAWTYGGKRFNGVEERPWQGPKFWCPLMKETLDYNNYPVLRYADAVLMLAEAYAGKKDEAGFLENLNAVKVRAGIAPYSFSDWDDAVEELRAERARELYGEFQRKFDLVRWGVWYDRVMEKNDWPQLKSNLKPCHRYLPIPDQQVTYSGGALDNKEYENSYTSE